MNIQTVFLHLAFKLKKIDEEHKTITIHYRNYPSVFSDGKIFLFKKQDGNMLASKKYF